jgi:PadR family transcriptional regulator PadR
LRPQFSFAVLLWVPPLRKAQRWGIPRCNDNVKGAHREAPANCAGNGGRYTSNGTGKNQKRKIPLAYRGELAYAALGYRGEWMSKPSDLVQGTLDLLLLKILALEEMNGFAISQRLKQVSGDVLQVSDGSLYPALHKLEHQGWITAEWKTTENNRRAKFYSLTRPGRKQLESETENWARLSSAISQVVRLEET